MFALRKTPLGKSFVAPRNKQELTNIMLPPSAHDSLCSFNFNDHMLKGDMKFRIGKILSIRAAYKNVIGQTSISCGIYLLFRNKNNNTMAFSKSAFKDISVLKPISLISVR